MPHWIRVFGVHASCHLCKAGNLISLRFGCCFPFCSACVIGHLRRSGDLIASHPFSSLQLHWFTHQPLLVPMSRLTSRLVQAMIIPCLHRLGDLLQLPRCLPLPPNPATHNQQSCRQPPANFADPTFRACLELGRVSRCLSFPTTTIMSPIQA
jgi:hypothetical protein